MAIALPATSQAQHSTLTLTADEQAWLKQHPIIRIGIDAAYAPYSFTDKKQHYVGVAPDLLALIEKRLNIRFEAVTGLNWPEIIDAARERRLDVIATAVITEERKKFLNFSQIYIPTPLVIMTRYDDKRIGKRDDLQQRKVALVEGYSSSQQVLHEYPSINPLMVTTALDGLRAVAAGEADAYVGVLGINVHLTSQHGISNLKVAARYNIESNGQRLAVRSDWPQLVQILDKALNDISAAEKLTVMRKWVPVDTPAAPLLTRERLIALAVTITLLTLLLIIAWIWGLRRQRDRLLREVSQQTRALHESERRLSLALEGGGMAAFDVDYESGEIVVSKGWWSMMGLVEADMPNPRERWLALIHSDDRDTVLGQAAAYMRGELDRFEVEYRVIPQKGILRWQIARGAALLGTDSDGRPSRMVGLVQDVTEHKELERIKDEFVASVSHELRTPLTSIKGALGLVTGGATGQLPPQATRILKIALENSERLNLLINDLLDMEKLRAGQMEFHMAPLTISDLLKDAVHANQGYADKFNVHIALQAAEDRTVTGDKTRLLQVMANLISNAAKFSPPGSEIKLDTACIDGRIRVTVRDQGQGIPDEFQGRIFERFSQADATDRQGKGGTGLGLAISREIIEQHDGRMGFSSKTGQGSAFYFELAANQA